MIDDVLKLVAVAVLVLVNGFFVAAQFALVSVRPTRINQLADEGNWAAGVVKRALTDPNRFISACQVGITMASLGLGWIAEPAIAKLIDGPLEAVFGDYAWISSHVIAAAIALLVVTLLHIVIGEQVPKMIAIQRSERTILVSAPPVNWLSIPFRPIIAILYWMTGIVLDILGLDWQGEHSLVYSEDELKMLVSASRQKGLLEASEQEMIERVFDFGDIETDEIMVPRTEMVAVPSSASLDEISEIVSSTGHTRFPVYGVDLDDIAGIFHAKDLLDPAIRKSEESLDLRRLLRPPVFVSTHTPLDELLTQMRDKRSHMAVVIDEYGGTAGVVTLADVLGRIVGDVQDQFEQNGVESEELSNGVVRVSGLMSIDDVNEQFGTSIDETFYNSIGGYVFGQLGRKPGLGDQVAANGHRFTVAALDGLRIERVDIEESGGIDTNLPADADGGSFNAEPAPQEAQL